MESGYKEQFEGFAGESTAESELQWKGDTMSSLRDLLVKVPLNLSYNGMFDELVY